MSTSTEAVAAALALVDADRINISMGLFEAFLDWQAAARDLSAEVRSIRAILSDASAVHSNMLRGTIAWTPEILRHVTGDDAVISELRDEVFRLRAMAIRLAEAAINNPKVEPDTREFIDALKAVDSIRGLK